jgi:hypothetical protein
MTSQPGGRAGLDARLAVGADADGGTDAQPAVVVLGGVAGAAAPSRCP